MSNNGFQFKKNTARKSISVNPAYYEGHHTTVILGDEQRFNNFNYNSSQNIYYDNDNFNTMNGQILNDFVPSPGFPKKKPLLGDRPRPLVPNFRSYSVDGIANSFGQSTEFYDNSSVPPGFNRKNQFRSDSPDDLPKLFKSPRKRAFENRHNFNNKKQCVQERVIDRGIKRQHSQGSATSGSDSNDNFNDIFGPDGIDRFDHQQNGAKTSHKNDSKQRDFKRARWDDSYDKKSSSRNRESDHRKGDPRKKERRSCNGSRRYHDRFDGVRRDHHRSSRSPSSENSGNSSSDLSKKSRERRSPDRGRMSGEEAKDRTQSRRKDSYSDSHKNDSRQRPSERDHYRHKDILGKSRKKEGLHKSNKNVVSENENPKGKISVEEGKSKNLLESDEKSNLKNRSDKSDNNTNKVNSVLKSVALNSDERKAVTPNSDKHESVALDSNKHETVTLNSDNRVSLTLNSEKSELVTLNTEKPESSIENSSTKIASENVKSKESNDNSNRKTDKILPKPKSLDNGNSKTSSDANKSPSLPKPVFSENSAAKQEQKTRNLFDLSFLSDKLKSPELKSLKRDIHRSSSEDKISENSSAKENPSTLSKELFKNSESKEGKEFEHNDDMTVAKARDSNSKSISVSEGAAKGSGTTAAKNLEGKDLNRTYSTSDKHSQSKDETRSSKDSLSSKRTLSIESKDKSVKTATEVKNKMCSPKTTLDSSLKSTTDSVKKSNSDTAKLSGSKGVTDSSKLVKESAKTTLPNAENKSKSQSLENKSKSSEYVKSNDSKNNSEISKSETSSNMSKNEKISSSSSSSTSSSTSSKISDKTNASLSSKSEKDSSKTTTVSSVQNSGSKKLHSKTSNNCDKLNASSSLKSEKMPSKMISNKESKDLSKCEKNPPKPSNQTKLDTTKWGTMSSKQLSTKKSQESVKLSKSDGSNSSSVSQSNKVLSNGSEDVKGKSKTEKTSKVISSTDVSKIVKEASNSTKTLEAQKSLSNSKDQKELGKSQPPSSESEKALSATPSHLKSSTDTLSSKLGSLKAGEANFKTMTEAKSSKESDIKSVSKLSPGNKKLKKKKHPSSMKSLQSSSLKSLKTSQKSSQLLSMASKLKYNSNKSKLKCEKRQNKPTSGVSSSAFKDVNGKVSFKSKEDFLTEQCISMETQENLEIETSEMLTENTRKRHKSEEHQSEKEKKRTRHKSEKIMSNFDIMSQNFSTSGKTLKLPLLLGNTRSSRSDDVPELSRGSEGESNKEINDGNDEMMTTMSHVPTSVITYGRGVKSLSPTKGSKHSELSSEGVVTSIMSNKEAVSGSENIDKTGMEGKNALYQPGTSDISSEDDETNTDDTMETHFEKQEKLKDRVGKEMNQMGEEQGGEKAKNIDKTASKVCYDSSEETCCESGGSTPLQDERSDYEMNEGLIPNKKSNGDLRLNLLVKKEPIDYDFVNIKKEPVDMEFDMNHRIKVEKDVCDNSSQNSEGINKDIRSMENNTPESISSTEDSTSDLHENRDNQKDNIETREKVNNSDGHEEKDNSGNLVIDFDNNSNSNMIETSQADDCNHGDQEEKHDSDLEEDSDVLKSSFRPETPNFSNLNNILGLDPKGKMSEENPTEDTESSTLNETTRNSMEISNVEKHIQKDGLENDKECNVKDRHLSEDLVSENSVNESEGRENNSLDETIAYCQSSEGDETIVEPASSVSDKVVEHQSDKRNKNRGHINDTGPNSSDNIEMEENATKDSNKMETMLSKDMNRTEIEVQADTNNKEVMAFQGQTNGQSSNVDKNTSEDAGNTDSSMSESLLDTDTDVTIQDASFNSDDLLQDEIDDDDVRVMVYVKGVPQSPWTPAPTKHELSEEEDEFDELMKKKDQLICDSKNDMSSNRIPSSLPCSPELTDINFESLSKGDSCLAGDESGDKSASDLVSDLKSTEVSKNSRNQQKEDYRSTESMQSSSKTFYATPIESSSASLETKIQNLDVMLKSLSESLAESNNPMNKEMFESLSSFSRRFSGFKSTPNNSTEDIASPNGNTKAGELDHAISSNSENGALQTCDIQNNSQRNDIPQAIDQIDKPQPKTAGDKCISLASGNVEELHIESCSRTMNAANANGGNNMVDKESNSVSVPRLVTMPTVSDSGPSYNDITCNRHRSGSSKTQHPHFSSSNIQHPNFSSSNAQQQPNFVTSNSQQPNFVGSNTQQPNFVGSNKQQKHFSSSSNAQQPENLIKNKTIGNASTFSESLPNPASRHQRSRTLPETYVSPEMQQQYQQAALKLNSLTDSRNMKNAGYSSQSNMNSNQMNPPPMYSSMQQRQVPRSTSDFQHKQNSWMGNDLSTDLNNFSKQTAPVDMNIRFTHIKTVIIQDTIRTINSVGMVIPMLYSDDLRRCVQCYNCKNFFSPLQFKMHMDGEMNNKVHLESLNAEFIPTRNLNPQEIAEWDKFLQIFNAEIMKRSKGTNQNQRPRHSPLNTQTQHNPSQITGGTAGPASRNVRRHTVTQPVNPATQQPMYHYSATQVPPPSSAPKGPMDPSKFDQQNHTSVMPDNRQSRSFFNPQSNQNMNRQNMPPNLVDPPSYQSSVSASHPNYGMPNLTRMQPPLSSNQTLQKSASSCFTESQHSHVQSISPVQKLSPNVPEASQSTGQSRVTPPTQFAEDISHNFNRNTCSSSAPSTSTSTLDIPTDNSNHGGSSPARSQPPQVSPEPNQRSSPGTSGSDSQNNIFRRDTSGGIQLNVQSPSDIIRAFRLAQNIQMECMTSMASYMGHLEDTVNRLEKELHLASLKNKESEDTLDKFGSTGTHQYSKNFERFLQRKSKFGKIEKIKDLYKQLNGSDNDT